MARIIVTYIVPLLLPSLLYVLWHAFIGRKRAQTADAATERGLRAAPWHWLGLAGLALMGLSLVVFADLSGAPPGSVYEPARIIDGKVVPGYSTPAEPRR